tara:strand:+ start:281 stop:556 length:276 start_codon:yes stop_codon:yes gene_type:complete
MRQKDYYKRQDAGVCKKDKWMERCISALTVTMKYLPAWNTVLSAVGRGSSTPPLTFFSLATANAMASPAKTTAAIFPAEDMIVNFAKRKAT